MYGSYPEMTIAMRYMAAKLERIKTFITNPPEKNWPLTYDDMINIAERISGERRSRVESRDNEIHPIRLV